MAPYSKQPRVSSSAHRRDGSSGVEAEAGVRRAGVRRAGESLCRVVVHESRRVHAARVRSAATAAASLIAGGEGLEWSGVGVVVLGVHSGRRRACSLSARLRICQTETYNLNCTFRVLSTLGERARHQRSNCHFSLK